MLNFESTLLPGTFVLIDGRTLNARFLAANLSRHWVIENNFINDITAMEIHELPLGDRNAQRLKYQLGPDVLNWPDPIKL